MDAQIWYRYRLSLNATDRTGVQLDTNVIAAESDLGRFQAGLVTEAKLLRARETSKTPCGPRPQHPTDHPTHSHPHAPKQNLDTCPDFYRYPGQGCLVAISVPYRTSM